MDDELLIERLKHILKTFKIEYEVIGFNEVKMGHINSTYKVFAKTNQNEYKQYIVQRLNTYVFKNPKAVMRNIDLITTHIRNINTAKALHFHHTIDGKNYFIEGNNFWRLYTYMDGIAIDSNINEEIMFQCGRAFGQFQNQLHDFDATKLEEIIPDFHNTTKRYQAMLESVATDPLDRVEKCKEEIKYIVESKDLALKLDSLKALGELPIRPTHNDTKTNNVLLDTKTHEPLIVIDLDTVMPGLIMHDFGDAIRYGANTAAEDEKDLTKVKLSLPFYEAFTKGFISEVGSSLSKTEIDNMALGAIAMTFELSTRFLKDYIDGDKYFKISYPEHNLIRAKCQLTLLKDMISHYQEMKDIVNKYCK